MLASCGCAAWISVCLFLTGCGEPIPWTSSLSEFLILSLPLGQVARPVVHQDTPPFEQVRAGMGRVDPIPDHMSQSRLNHQLGMVRPTRPVPEGRAEPVRHGREMIDDFCLWGSRRCRRTHAPLTRGGGSSSGARVWQPQRFSLRGRGHRRCGRGLAWKALLEAVWHGFPASAATTVAGRRPACPRRVVAPHWRGRKWRERPPDFCRWCGTGEGKDGKGSGHPLPPPFGGRSLHSDPCGPYL